MRVGTWSRQAGLVGLVWVSMVVPSAAQTSRTPAAVTGPITLTLDARETPKRIFHVRETIPVTPGPLTLVYPKWLPGEHEPAGPIADVVGLHVSANGQPLPWRRNPLDVYAFHVTVPGGARIVEVSFDFLSALSTSGFTSAASVTAHLGVYSWKIGRAHV